MTHLSQNGAVCFSFAWFTMEIIKFLLALDFLYEIQAVQLSAVSIKVY